MQGEGLRRDLGLLGGIGVGLGAIIGAGIFVVLGVAAGVAGPALLAALFIAGVAATCNALSSAQLAAAYPQSGGTYEYGYRVLNPWLGFAAGWMFLASKLAAGGTVAIGFGSYVAKVLPTVDPRLAAVWAAAALIMANFLGIRKAGGLNLIIVAVTLSALIYLCASAAPAFSAENLTPFAPGGFVSVIQAAALLFFAYTGYARLATLGEEMSEPERNIPRAIIWSLAVASVVYAAVALVALGAVGAPALAETASPLEVAARAGGLPATQTIVVIGAATAMLGVLLSQILGISRMMFAMARRRDLPGVLEHLNAQGVPDVGILVTGVFIIAVAWFGTLEAVVSAAAFTILLYYSVTNWAALKMRPEDRLFPPWVPMLGLAFCLSLSVFLSARAIFFGLALLVAGIVLRLLFRRKDGTAGPGH